MNLVNLTELSPSGTMLDYSSGHIATEVSAPLVEDLQAHLGDETFRFIPGVQYRHLLVHKGGRANPRRPCTSTRPTTSRTSPSAPTCASFSRCPRMWDLLFLPRSACGRPPVTPKRAPYGPGARDGRFSCRDFAQSYALKGAVISAVDLVRGLAARRAWRSSRSWRHRPHRHQLRGQGGGGACIPGAWRLRLRASGRPG